MNEKTLILVGIIILGWLIFSGNNLSIAGIFERQQDAGIIFSNREALPNENVQFKAGIPSSACGQSTINILVNNQQYASQMVDYKLNGDSKCTPNGVPTQGGIDPALGGYPVQISIPNNGQFSNWATVQLGGLISTSPAEIYFEPKACADTQNYVTKIVSVKAGETLSLKPIVGQLSFVGNPVFCATQPVLKKIGDTTIQQDVFPYKSLLNGGTITVPAGQVWIFFYNVRSTGETLTVCADGSIYDSILNKCVIKPTIEYTCFTGQFNPETKTCVTQANSETVCLQGVFNQSTLKCEKVLTAVDTLCPVGATLMDGKCIIEPEIKLVCKDGILNQGVCEKIASTGQPVATASGQANGAGSISSLMIVVGLVVLVGLSIYFNWFRR